MIRPMRLALPWTERIRATPLLNKRGCGINNPVPRIFLAIGIEPLFNFGHVKTYFSSVISSRVVILPSYEALNDHRVILRRSGAALLLPLQACVLRIAQRRIGMCRKVWRAFDPK